ncbi:alpha/beta fold hydrolase [Nannocystis pusilla]|uniref:alpha/beta fold hydrolase n=1 Tax=Nannocystis pusilla TaxID=889268 RepID=UPI003BF2E53E
MAVLTLPDGELYYEVHGSGPPLVFAHGLGGGFLSWWQQVPHFRKRFSCVVFSHRGFAPSKDASGQGPRRFVDDLDALLQHLHVDDVRLVGQSMGGWSCLGYALRRPEKVRALVMACTTGQVTTPEIDAAINRLRGRATAAFMKGVHPAAGERMVRDQPAMHELYRGMDVLGAADKRAIRDVLLDLRTVTARDLEGFEVPTLCMTADEDFVCAPDSVAHLARMLVGGRFVKVPETGHSIYWERPALFNRLVDEFLDSVE